MLSTEQTKKQAANQALTYLQTGMTIGIGTGTTVRWFIEALAGKVKQGFNCQCVPTSAATNHLASSLGIPMRALNDVEKIDVTVDGADEIDPQLSLIKGGGGALLQEKMVAAVSGKLVIIADSRKSVKQLGAFPLPVEVIPYGWKQVQRKIASAYQVQAELRMNEDKAFTSDHGHYILDCHFNTINDPAALAQALNLIPGVVENGLFIKMASVAIFAYPDGTIQTKAAGGFLR